MNMHASVADRFRPIQYLGNKTRLLDEIAQAVESVVAPQGLVADLFSGTAVVGRRLARRNGIVAVDIQAYAEILGRAMLQGKVSDLSFFDVDSFLVRAEATVDTLTRLFAPMMRREEEALAALRAGNPQAISEIIEGGSPLSMLAGDLGRALPIGVRALASQSAGHGLDATATMAFGGVYFAFMQAIWLDALHYAATQEPEHRRDVLLAVMLGVASEIVNTVGKQFAQPIRLLDKRGERKPLLIQRTLRDRGLDVRDLFLAVLGRWRNALAESGSRQLVVRADVDAFLESDNAFDAAYADPPYTIDHYSRFYHVLETLVRRDQPVLSQMRKKGIPTIMRGLYREDRFQSDFCVPSKARNAFHRLFCGVARRGAPLVLSYSGHVDASGQRPRTLSVDEIAALARRSFRSVEITEPTFEGHRKLNAAHRNASTESGSERLLICRS